jgi:hypothetical protein
MPTKSFFLPTIFAYRGIAYDIKKSQNGRNQGFSQIFAC